MSESPRCPKCNALLPADAPAGLCPKCLLKAGFESQPAPPPGTAPTRSSPASAAFEPPAPAELADKFPQLEILELLGKGGMGAVYKARQRGLDRLVAVKILPPEVGRDAAFAERFAREARALARLSHHNIVSVYDFGRTDDNWRGSPTSTQPAATGATPSPNAQETFGQASGSVGDRPQHGLYYIVMEYVDGLNLRQTIQAGTLAPAEALTIVPQICEALQFAHDEGIVHRDIKPENILIDRRGRVKIADFGLAKLLGPNTSNHTLTAAHQVMGTLRYMAPEQMQGSGDVDHRADIYSLGVVFYEMLTGELPVGRFAPPSKKVQVDVRLDEVVLRALEQQPAMRYQRVSEVKTDLDHIARVPASVATVQHQPNRVVSLEEVREVQTLLLAPANMLLATGVLALVSIPLVAGFCLWALERRVWAAGSRSFWRWGDEEFWYCLLYFQVLVMPAAVFTILAAQRMRRCELRGMAVAGAGLALLPWSPAWLFGLPAGIWGLIVLSHRHVKAAFQMQSRTGAAPPTALTDTEKTPLPSTIVVSGFLTLLSSVLTILLLTGVFVDRNAFDAFFRKDGIQVSLLVMQTLAIPAGIFIVVCGLTMKSGTWGLVRLGAILSLIPLTPSWLITVPLGLFVLIEMTRSRPREASQSIEENPRGPRLSRFALIGAIWGGLGLLGLIVGVLLTSVSETGPSDQMTAPPESLRLLGLAILSVAVALGASAVIGTTIFGAVAIGHIKHSTGTLYGLGMAIVDVLLFPLIALGGAVFAVSHFALIAIWRHWPGTPSALHAELPPPADFPGTTFMVFDAIAALVVCYFVARAVWRRIAGSAAKEQST